MTTKSRVFRIFGEVQGVGYRAATLRQAQSLGLTGWVCNLRDGSVETLAFGSETQLGRFRDWLQQGPAYASVTDVSESPAVVDEPPAEFRIR